MTGGAIAVVGAGPEAEAWAAALGAEAPTDLAGLASADRDRPALVVDAWPDDEAGARAARLGALLAALPGDVPVLVVTRRHLVEALIPGARHAPRVLGAHRVARVSGPTSIVEVVLPRTFDDAVVDLVLDRLGEHGLEPLPCGDGPGRIVDRLLATAWGAAGAGSRVEADLAGRGMPLDALPAAMLPRMAAAIVDGLGGAPRFESAGWRAEAGPADPDLIELAVIAEAYRLVGEAVAGAAEIERAMSAGAGWAAGPFTLAGRRGLRATVTAVAALGRDPAADPATADRFAMPPLLWRMATA